MRAATWARSLSLSKRPAPQPKPSRDYLQPSASDGNVMICDGLRQASSAPLAEPEKEGDLPLVGEHPGNFLRLAAQCTKESYETTIQGYSTDTAGEHLVHSRHRPDLQGC